MNSDTAAHFDRVLGGKSATPYNFDVAVMGAKDRRIIRELTEYGVEGRHCLDIGSGTGRWLQFLRQQRPALLAAVDFSEEAVERAEEICDKVQKVDVEVEPFTYPDNSFDIVISFEVIEHLRTHGGFMSELIRVAKPGALVLLSTPNLIAFNSRIRMLLGVLPVAVASDPTHISFFTPERLSKLLQASGQSAEHLNTSVSLHLLDFKRWCVTPPRCLRSLVDSLLFKFRVSK